MYMHMRMHMAMYIRLHAHYEILQGGRKLQVALRFGGLTVAACSNRSSGRPLEHARAVDPLTYLLTYLLAHLLTHLLTC